MSVIVAMSYKTALRRAAEQAAATGRRQCVQKLAPWWIDRTRINDAWAVVEVDTPRNPPLPITCPDCGWTYTKPYPGVRDPLDTHRDVCDGR